ncbi:MAG: hypothetical protein WCT04_23865 [Planctomycetota bacterium]
MNSSHDKNYISVGSWMWMMFVSAIPIVGFIMFIVWTFSGENDSRKNYFRAIWAWFFIIIALVVVLAALGNAPGLMKEIQTWSGKKITA